MIGMFRGQSIQDQLMALTILFCRQYWWRTWIIEKVVCAKNAMVLCGDKSVSLMELRKTCDTLEEEEEHLLLSIYLKSPSYVRTLTNGGLKGLQVSRYHTLDAIEPLLSSFCKRARNHRTQGTKSMH